MNDAILVPAFVLDDMPWVLIGKQADPTSSMPALLLLLQRILCLLSRFSKFVRMFEHYYAWLGIRKREDIQVV